jgi:hypothetical protein
MHKNRETYGFVAGDGRDRPHTETETMIETKSEIEKDKDGYTRTERSSLHD